ncbi:MAG TPA: type VI secretion system tip protein TssI/VgrG [Polyangiaceae bacterium]|nr:type VI secretion system tip protein TssI/VgrG [Polyangiaceae bacterium]
MPLLELSFSSGEDSLSVRRFTVNESISSLFTVSIWARSESPSIDLEGIVGQEAAFRIASGMKFARTGGARYWTGICSFIEQVHGVQPSPGQKPLSTYHLRIVPKLYLLSQRRNSRIFQHTSIPDITDALLGDWGLDHDWDIDRGKYPKLEYCVQYGESDLAFLSRLWELAGIAYTFPDDDQGGSTLTLSDKIHQNPPRPGGGVHYVDNPNQASEKEFVTHVRLAYEVRPGAATYRDYDFRNPGFQLLGSSGAAPAPEDRYEQFHYTPGGFLIETGKGGNTPVADDQGAARHDQPYGQERARRAFEAERTGRRAISFDTNTIDLWPGVVFNIDNHPHPEIGGPIVVTDFSVEGAPDEEWSMSGQAVFTDVPYRPAMATPKPEVVGVQSATVVGPKGQEIHTDEFGRVRVQFPWDREGKSDEFSSCWIRVSQGWAGTGYGMIVLPRVGQEVLVGFLQGDPDQPVVVGRVFNATQQVPYKLPDHKTRSAWKSDSSPGSGGFNEIMFEDLAGQELVYVQAEKNRRKLVKNDETITVGHDLEKLVKNDELERTIGNRKIWVGKDEDIIVNENKRERVEGLSHLRVFGDRRTKVDQNVSVIVGKSRHEKIGKNHAVSAGKQIHMKAGSAVVIEAAKDLTFRAPGGFVRIDGSGITILGTVVRINSGGSPGSGNGASPIEPDEAVEAVTDDVSKTLIGQ